MGWTWHLSQIDLFPWFTQLLPDTTQSKRVANQIAFKPMSFIVNFTSLRVQQPGKQKFGMQL
jgi:hypothetical protein